MQCEYKKPNGTQCKCNTLKNSRYCLYHSPKRLFYKENMQNKKKLAIKLPPLTIDTVDDIPPLLIDTIRGIRSDVIETRKGATIGYLTNILLKSFEVTYMEKRLARLEGILNDVYVSGDIESILQEIHPDPDKELDDEDYEDKTKEKEFVNNINEETNT